MCPMIETAITWVSVGLVSGMILMALIRLMMDLRRQP